MRSQKGEQVALRCVKGKGNKSDESDEWFLLLVFAFFSYNSLFKFIYKSKYQGKN